MKHRKNGKEFSASVVQFPSGFWGIKITYEDKSTWWLTVSLRSEENAFILAEAFMDGRTLDLGDNPVVYAKDIERVEG
jgi:hypothetical protein